MSRRMERKTAKKTHCSNTAPTTEEKKI